MGSLGPITRDTALIALGATAMAMALSVLVLEAEAAGIRPL